MYFIIIIYNKYFKVINLFYFKFIFIKDYRFLIIFSKNNKFLALNLIIIKEVII
jgi:hypothetical protein